MKLLFDREISGAFRRIVPVGLGLSTATSGRLSIYLARVGETPMILLSAKEAEEMGDLGNGRGDFEVGADGDTLDRGEKKEPSCMLAESGAGVPAYGESGCPSFHVPASIAAVCSRGNGLRVSADGAVSY